MAKGGNTWFKKLRTKEKQFILKQVLGNENNVMGHCARAKPLTARDKNLDDIKDKPLPKGPSYPAKGKTPLPRVAGWKPEPYPVKLMAKPLNTSFGKR